MVAGIVRVLNAIVSVIYLYLIMHDPNKLLTFGGWKGAVLILGKLTLAAGACAIAAGIWRSTTGKSWLLATHGLALSALGVIYIYLTGFRISFRTIALLIILMAMSIAIFEFVTARTLRLQRYVADVWFLRLAGAVSFGFVLVFFMLGFGGVKI